MKGKTSNKVNHFKESQYYFVMGRQIFSFEEKVLLIFFTVPLIVFFFFCTSAPKNKSKRGALFSECGSAYERLLWYGWVWGWKEQITLYSLQKTRLHHWLE